MSYRKPKRQKLEREAIERLRSLRAGIDEDLLRAAREAIEGAGRNETADLEGEMIPIDRDKNLRTISKFLEMNPGAAALHKDIADLLNGNPSGKSIH